jgi:Fe-S-cluster containining protein
MADDDRKPDDAIVRGELHDALRFVYAMSSQSSEQIDNVDTILAALVKVLLETGKLQARDVEAMLPQAREALDARAAAEIAVDVARTNDKYEAKGPDDLDCAALIPLCKGRCCRLTFALSFQDLDEGGIRWDYAHPYRILHGDDSYCVHSHPESRGCTVYDKRPTICRVYDCRKDDRIWTDFDQRIPAPFDKITPQEARLYQIRRPAVDPTSRMESAAELAKPFDPDDEPA